MIGLFPKEMQWWPIWRITRWIRGVLGEFWHFGIYRLKELAHIRLSSSDCINCLMRLAGVLPNHSHWNSWPGPKILGFGGKVGCSLLSERSEPKKDHTYAERRRLVYQTFWADEPFWMYVHLKNNYKLIIPAKRVGQVTILGTRPNPSCPLLYFGTLCARIVKYTKFGHDQA